MSCLPRCKKPNALFLLCLFGLAIATVVSVTPALIEIAIDFSISQNSAHRLIGYGLFGYAIGPLFAGPISDAFGRRRAIFFGILVEIVGLIFNIVAYHASFFPLFLFGHSLSVFGGAMCIAMVYTVVHDFYDFVTARKVLSSIVSGFLLVPGAMTLLSGLIAGHFHWIGAQYLLIAFCGLLLICTIAHPETMTKAASGRVEIAHALKSYWTVGKDGHFLRPALLVGFSISALYLFISEGAVIALRVFHLSSQDFGWLSPIPYIGGALSLLLVSRYHHRISFDGILLFSIGALLVLTSGFFALFLIGWVDFLSFCLLSALVVACAMPVNVSGVSMMQRDISDKSHASPLLITLFIAISELFIQVGEVLRSTMGPIAYPSLLFLLSIFSAVDYALIRIVRPR